MLGADLAELAEGDDGRLEELRLLLRPFGGEAGRLEVLGDRVADRLLVLGAALRELRDELIHFLDRVVVFLGGHILFHVGDEGRDVLVPIFVLLRGSALPACADAKEPIVRNANATKAGLL